MNLSRICETDMADLMTLASDSVVEAAFGRVCRSGADLRREPVQSLRVSNRDRR